MADDVTGRALEAVVAQAVASLRRKPDTLSVSAAWTGADDWEASLVADSTGVRVWFGPGSASVASVDEAVALLEGIFADEIVCVTALEHDQPVHYALARRDDPTASFTQPDGPRSRMPSIDQVMLKSWTGKHDRA